ncbi:MAG TPA: autotransporter-associated beta strand repeat-containing protein, partial [Pirellulales bacterium]|nr:autotransporter-associated beta strand repeat-containing protein [Pirellulales bacterium]
MRAIVAALIAVFIQCVFLGSALAQSTYTVQPGDPPGPKNLSDNSGSEWNTVPTGTTTTLTFNDTIGAITLNNDINGTSGFTSLTTIQFTGNQSITLTGNAFTFNAAVSNVTISTTQAVTETFTAPVAFTGALTNLGATTTAAGSIVDFSNVTLGGNLSVSANLSANVLGTVFVTGGNRQIGSNNTITASSYNNISLNDNGTNRTLSVSGNGRQIFTGSFIDNGSAGAAVAFNSTGTTTLLGNSSAFLGNITISAGTVAIGTTSGALGQGQISITGNSTLSSAVANLNISNNVALSATLATAGAQPLTLSGLITQSGGNRTISNATSLTIGGTLALSETAAAGRMLTVNGTGSTFINTTVNTGGAATGGLVLAPSAGGTATITGLTIAGAGVPLLTFSGNAASTTTLATSLSTFTASNFITLSSGTLAVATNSTPFGSASLFLGAGTLSSQVSGLNVNNSATIVGNVTVTGSQALTLSGNLAVGVAAAAITNSNPQGLTISGGLALSDGLSARTLTLGGTQPIFVTGNVTNSGGFNNTLAFADTAGVTLSGNLYIADLSPGQTLTLSGTQSGTISGTIRDGGLGGILAMGGTGTVTLSGANLYTGGTQINSGTLAINSNASLGAAGDVSFVGAAGGLRFIAPLTTLDAGRSVLVLGTAGTIDNNGGSYVTIGGNIGGSATGAISFNGTGYTTVSGAVTGVTGLNNVNGTTNLVQGYNGSGTITLTAGTLIAQQSLTQGGATNLFTGTNTTLINQSTSAQTFGTLTLSGPSTISSSGNMTFANIGSSTKLPALTLNGPATFVDNGAMASVSFVIGNGATLSLSAAAAQLTTGATTSFTLNTGGTVAFDNTSSDVARLVGTGTTALTMAGGTLQFLTPNAGVNSTLSFNGVTLNAGSSTIDFGATGQAATIAGNTLTRAAGGVLDITSSATIGSGGSQGVTISGLTAGQVLPFVFINGSDFAVNGLSTGLTAATGLYTSLATGATITGSNGSLYNLTGTSATVGTSTSNAAISLTGLRLGPGTTVNANAVGQALSFSAVGGVAFNSNMGAILAYGSGTSTINSALSWTNTSDLVIRTDLASTNLVVNGNVLPVGSGANFVKDGLGSLTINGILGIGASATLFVDAGVVNLGGTTNPLTGTPNMAVQSAATVNLNGYNTTLGALTGAGTVQLGVSGTPTLTIGSGNAAPNFTGSFATGGATTTLVKIGTGSATLNADLSGITGGVSLSAGTMIIGSTASQLFTGGLSLGAGTNLSFTALAGATGANSLGNLTLSAGAQGAINNFITFTSPGTLTFAGLSRVTTGGYELFRGLALGGPAGGTDLYFTSAS